MLGLKVFQEPKFYRLPYPCYLYTVHNGCPMLDMLVDLGSYGTVLGVSKII